MFFQCDEGHALQPRVESGRSVLLIEIAANELDQARRPIPIPTGNGMTGCFIDELVLLEPCRGSPVQRIQLRCRRLLSEAVTQHVGQEVMISIPMTKMVQWNDEEMATFKVSNRCRAVLDSSN